MSQTFPSPLQYSLGSENEQDAISATMLGANIHEETLAKMKNTKGSEPTISERWPELRKEAQNETDPEKLILILEEIEDLLFNLEMRLASEYGKRRKTADAKATLDRIVDYEIGSE